MDASNTSRRPTVVIVGGGFGGLSAARALKGAPVDVLLIDRRNHHVFQPLLYQVATAAPLARRHRVAHPLDSPQAAERAGVAGGGRPRRRGAPRARPRRRRGAVRLSDPRAGCDARLFRP